MAPDESLMVAAPIPTPSVSLRKVFACPCLLYHVLGKAYPVCELSAKEDAEMVCDNIAWRESLAKSLQSWGGHARKR